MRELVCESVIMVLWVVVSVVLEWVGMLSPCMRDNERKE